jgi:hypothetical protein
VFCASLRQFDVFAPHVSAVLFQMAIFIQLLRHRKTKTSKMLPPVAAVLPAEKGNETLVKWGLLPCCRFSGPLSINLALPAILGGKCRLDSGLHAALAMSRRDGCDARVLQVLQISQFVAPL